VADLLGFDLPTLFGSQIYRDAICHPPRPVRSRLLGLLGATAASSRGGIGGATCFLGCRNDSGAAARIQLRRRLHGWSPDCVARDSLFRDLPLQGTVFSAPVTTLVTQSVATAVLFRRHSRVAAGVLAVIGLLNVPGYIFERLVRQRLSASGWGKLESPLNSGRDRTVRLDALVRAQDIAPG
jgi:hypothetical protein